MIEFKPIDGTQNETDDKTIELVKKHNFQEQAMFMSMDTSCVTRMHKKRPDWWTGYCAYGSLETFV